MQFSSSLCLINRNEPFAALVRINVINYNNYSRITDQSIVNCSIFRGVLIDLIKNICQYLLITYVILMYRTQTRIYGFTLHMYIL